MIIKFVGLFLILTLFFMLSYYIHEKRTGNRYIDAWRNFINILR